MKFELVTRVRGDFREVFKQFDKELLLKLTPPGMQATLKRYDEPPAVGNLVELEVKMWGLMRQEWRNEITELVENDAECFFVDEGLAMPWPLKYWRHKHLIRNVRLENGEEGAEVVDQIEYKAGWMGALIYPVVWAQFAWRKPQYRKFFGVGK